MTTPEQPTASDYAQICEQRLAETQQPLSEAGEAYKALLIDLQFLGEHLGPLAAAMVRSKANIAEMYRQANAVETSLRQTRQLTTRAGMEHSNQESARSLHERAGFTVDAASSLVVALSVSQVTLHDADVNATSAARIGQYTENLHGALLPHVDGPTTLQQQVADVQMNAQAYIAQIM